MKMERETLRTQLAAKEQAIEQQQKAAEISSREVKEAEVEADEANEMLLEVASQRVAAKANAAGTPNGNCC